MPNSNDDALEVVVDTDALQLASLASGCPSGNIYSGALEQPTRQGLRSPEDLRGE